MTSSTLRGPYLRYWNGHVTSDETGNGSRKRKRLPRGSRANTEQTGVRSSYAIRRVGGSGALRRMWEVGNGFSIAPHLGQRLEQRPAINRHVIERALAVGELGVPFHETSVVLDSSDAPSVEAVL